MGAGLYCTQTTMTRHYTAGEAHTTERQKAWARLALLTVIGLICPPLAAARSGLMWGLYLLLVVVYSLWAIRVTYKTGNDRFHGYLLTWADALVLIPLMVWSPGFAMRVVLAMVWAAGAGATVQAARARVQGSGRVSRERGASADRRARRNSVAEPLARAVGARLHVLFEQGTRFGLVLLRITEHQEIVDEYGEEGAQRLVRAVGLKGLRYLGADAQLFQLAGGRVAYVFATDAWDSAADESRAGWPESQREACDIEGLAMAVARRSCEGIIEGYRLECVVGWAAAPADGTSVDDLMYAAESGVLSKAAFRRVNGTSVPVPQPEKKRAVAG